MHIFYEPKPRVLAHTTLSAAIPSFSPNIQQILLTAVILDGMIVEESLRVSPGESEANTPPVPGDIPYQKLFPTTGCGFGAAVSNSLLVSRVLHDWPDRDYVKILEDLIPVIAKGNTKLFIIDRVLPEKPREMFLHQEALMQSLGLLMCKERSLGEWKTLFKDADGRLKIERVDMLVNSDLGMLEVVME
ncbi:uncharacterized protein Z519_01952 [Cladophialophora bantiana CBS 173.52]|uniref:O-methyltransferase C-terminal domain-containing protein n=1 Tax=Cladophialophora bantiana (strain ATCC 10958 / CBS 173.52 / CDC B-1940 / NIH 8579) TaxID=1442370 RepID=A0A0D2F2Y8_CLAB1|nr:uncharacterized protein Z519_01952 [Cladophialophora bantiana CBS 173.52]KIW96561.1 hypothetical protein Z519_01952 [Cladophialophora bantiana CBS 173.52]